MNLLQLHGGSKHFGAKALFDDARFSINDGEHVGVSDLTVLAKPPYLKSSSARNILIVVTLSNLRN